MFRREAERDLNKENSAGMNCGNIVEAPSRAAVRHEFVRALGRARRCAVIFREPVEASRSVLPRRGSPAKISPQLARSLAVQRAESSDEACLQRPWGNAGLGVACVVDVNRRLRQTGSSSA
jgi:hypothetical protein